MLTMASMARITEMMKTGKVGGVRRLRMEKGLSALNLKDRDVIANFVHAGTIKSRLQ
jgi:hypothetical protein